MLLDLLGTKNPKFYNYFVETVDLYRSLISAESILNKTSCFNEYTSAYFKPMSAFLRIEDDHIPFLHRGKLLKINFQGAIQSAGLEG